MTKLLGLISDEDGNIARLHYHEHDELKWYTLSVDEHYITLTKEKMTELRDQFTKTLEEMNNAAT